MSVIADFQVNGLNPSSVGGVGTTAKYFPRVLGSSIGVASVAPSATSAAGQLTVPAFGELQGQIFKIKAAGDVLPFTGGGTYTIDIQANTGSLSSPSYTTLATTGAVTLASATAVNWFLEASMSGTNNAGATPGKLDGYFSGSTNGVNIALTQISNPLSGLNFVTGQSSSGSQGGVIGLVARVTFNTSLAQNFARLYQFQVIAD
jgi:hypothetical protein